ncbi:hypothetical protein Acid345_1095 [Candidatus Koribacter versatilis Ellin345]|uniref:PRTase-CE domain-containing protein n=1 Tax=Koribacter versatilis (strain Ellin345) TaxID=204669 RepID=Q1ISQ2_KORVE|nr:hypothetical protein [Candidatus Koribacter versatilis]ABF40098.1 hypothetical protein Acid345_1095 [Candidatus Koribacter versatilis Ellin345]
MRSPLPRGVKIDAKRYKRWVDRFGAYRSGIVNITIDGWLQQFSGGDRDLAARVLDAVEFYDQTKIHAAYRQALASLTGWDKLPSKRVNKWRFAAMSGSAGESGDAMLYQFRLANGLDSKKFNDLFVSRSDLFRLPLLSESDPNRISKDDTVVLLDDFSGTGTQVCKAWNDPETSFGALLADVGKVYLILVAASGAARKRISEETTITPLPVHELHDGDNVFSTHCSHFNGSDKAKLLRYGRVADSKHPKGFGDCGFVIVFQHRTPNNSIPILHADHPHWTGLFPRHV